MEFFPNLIGTYTKSLLLSIFCLNALFCTILKEFSRFFFIEGCILKCSVLSLKQHLHWSVLAHLLMDRVSWVFSTQMGKHPSDLGHWQIWPFVIVFPRPNIMPWCHLKSDCLIFNIKLCSPFTSLLPCLKLHSNHSSMLSVQKQNINLNLNC